MSYEEDVWSIYQVRAEGGKEGGRDGGRQVHTHICRMCSQVECVLCTL